METITIFTYFFFALALYMIIYASFFKTSKTEEDFVKSKAKTKTSKTKEKFQFETDPDMNYPISQIRLDNVSPPPCKGGLIGRPLYFDYTSSTDVANTCGEQIPDDQLGKDTGFRGRRPLSSFNRRDPNII